MLKINNCKIIKYLMKLFNVYKFIIMFIYWLSAETTSGVIKSKHKYKIPRDNNVIWNNKLTTFTFHEVITKRKS